jgi:hypothetical protein
MNKAVVLANTFHVSNILCHEITAEIRGDFIPKWRALRQIYTTKTCVLRGCANTGDGVLWRELLKAGLGSKFGPVAPMEPRPGG